MGKSILVLGSGMVARPGIRYLLERTNHAVTVADQRVEAARSYIGGHPQGRAVEVDAESKESLRSVVRGHDLAISLFPPPFHPRVAEVCIEEGIDMVTTSYAGDAMSALHGAAVQRDVVLLNEIGVDPGIDHMSAIKIIHEAQRNGREVASFCSYCGGLPAPDSNNNPLGYKFSWRPAGVLSAMKSDAKFLGKGVIIPVPASELFKYPESLNVPGAGELEFYPNRDCLGYLEIYGIENAETMYRGTLRYPGWCSFWDAALEIGLLDEAQRDLKGLTYRDFMQKILRASAPEQISTLLAMRAGLKPESGKHQSFKAALEWLGFLSDSEIPGNPQSSFAVVADLLNRKPELWYQPGERDMLVMLHEFEVRHGKQAQRVTSTLVDFGIPGGDSSMARTVSLPAAIAADLIASNRSVFPLRGVCIPTHPAIYNPVLQKLAELGIRMEEKTEESSGF